MTTIAEETLALRCGEFSSPSRYLCLHLLFPPVQLGSRLTFTPKGMLSYHIMLLHESTASVMCLMPVYYRRPPRSTSELLRTL
jgi:hypothetical protein